MNATIHSKMFWLVVLLIAILAMAAVRYARASDPQKVREAGVAGGFYPADPKELAAMIDEMSGARVRAADS